MKKTILLLSLLILPLLISNVNADVGDGGVNVRIIDNDLSITGYYYSQFIATDTINGTNEVIDNLHYDLGAGSMICHNFVNGTSNDSVDYVNGVNVTNTYVFPTNCSFALNINYSKQLPLKSVYMRWLKNLSITTTTPSGGVLVSPEQLVNWTNCMVDKSVVETNLRVTAAECFRTNATQQEIVLCTAEKATCQTEKTGLQNQITELGKTKDEGKNTRWIYGVVGLVLGILGTLYSKGHIGGPKTRRPEENYNVRQSA